MSSRSCSHSDLPTLLALGGQERIGHAAADDQEIDLFGQIAEQLELGRDLGAADHRRQRAGRIFQGLGQGFQFRLHGAAAKSRHFMRQAFGRGMGAMGGGKGVVDIDVAEFGHLCDQRRIVLFLALVEAGVFQQQQIAVRHFGDRSGSLVADAILGEADRLANQSGHGFGHGLQGEIGVGRALGPAEMGQHDDLAALVGNFVQGRQDALEAGRVGDPAFFHRHVDVDADKHALALEFSGIEGAKTGHGESRRSGAWLRRGEKAAGDHARSRAAQIGVFAQTRHFLTQKGRARP